jgi:ribonuclease P protein component
MLLPPYRLTKVRDFNLLMKYGRWIKGNFLDIRYSYLQKIPQEAVPKRILPEEFVHQLKIAFTVGLKVDKRAVVRNRVRRQLREIVRLLIKDNRIQRGFYILIVARKEVLGKEYADLQKEIENDLRLAKILQ